ncbi:hypothetical protein [Streptomyces carpinensis]|uniref:Secreted protein n=1 Tax=Streptomyces carpinensis TaxID=66369 RepID=A0ABV1WEM2_9ACTN|nr:hypothetical protein [Streptomyces carpinensis]
MILNRSHAITAAVAAASALASTGITYASAAVASSLVAPTVRQVPAPVQVPSGGDTGNGSASKGNEGNEGNHGGNRHHHFEEGWIHINERSYSAHPGGCITVVSGLGSTSLNVRNDSRRTVEVFRGVTCDNGAPVATVGPRSSANGITPGTTRAVVVKDGVVGSFRVVDDHDYGDYDDYDV